MKGEILMKKIIAVLLMMAVMLCGCGNNETSVKESLESETVQKSEEKEAEDQEDVEYTNGFEKAKYDKFNLAASENGLGGTKTYVFGTVGDSVSYFDGTGIYLIDKDKNEWLIWFDEHNNEEMKENLKNLSGKEIEVFGEYIGYAGLFEAPVIKIYSTNNEYYAVADGEKITPALFINKAGLTGEQIQIFSSDFQTFKEWFGENSKEIIYSEYINEENKETYKTSAGTVSDISSSIKWMDFIQRTEDGYFKQAAKLENVILENSTNFEDFQIGDGIKIYYYINENNEDEILAIEKTEPEFSLDEYVNYYKEQCKEYTYEDIARNPENMNGEYAKLKGKVIQVLESGNAVQIRVDITVSEYGNYSDTIFVSYYKKSETEDRILEDDIITIYGKLDGTETYNAVLGQQITLPKINAEYVEIN
jgi:hypothetical protein